MEKEEEGWKGGKICNQGYRNSSGAFVLKVFIDRSDCCDSGMHEFLVNFTDNTTVACTYTHRRPRLG